MSVYNEQMTFAKALAILALISVGTLCPACSGKPNSQTNSYGSMPSNSANTNVNTVRSDVGELGLLVNVPYETEDIVWKEYPSQKQVIAVLRFSTADSAKLVADAEKIKPSEPTSVPSETWFPPELTAQSEMTGEDNLNGRAYAANQFFQEPYSNGRLVRIDNTDYFVLDLTAK